MTRMQDALLLAGADARRKRSAFWVLLGLAAAIASAGILMDSTATVIGAMIVAPLMGPILGTALALVLARRAAMLRCLAFVLGGAFAVVAVGYLFGFADPLGVAMEGNAQIASRVRPRMIDLAAALATGTVGAFAVARSDVSDTLPGVAIAISLVPPLAVVGILLESGQVADALGALLLFATNAAAIIATGTAVFLGYRVRDVAAASGETVGRLRGRTLAAVLGLVLVVAVPLAYGTASLVSDHRIKLAAVPIASVWADEQGWQVLSLEVLDGRLDIVALGPPPEVDPEDLRSRLDAAGLAHVDLGIDLVVGGTRELPGDG